MFEFLKKKDIKKEKIEVEKTDDFDEFDVVEEKPELSSVKNNLNIEKSKLAEKLKDKKIILGLSATAGTLLLLAIFAPVLLSFINGNNSEIDENVETPPIEERKIVAKNSESAPVQPKLEENTSQKTAETNTTDVATPLFMLDTNNSVTDTNISDLKNEENTILSQLSTGNTKEVKNEKIAPDPSIVKNEADMRNIVELGAGQDDVFNSMVKTMSDDSDFGKEKDPYALIDKKLAQLKAFDAYLAKKQKYMKNMTDFVKKKHEYIKALEEFEEITGRESDKTKDEKFQKMVDEAVRKATESIQNKLAQMEQMIASSKESEKSSLANLNIPNLKIFEMANEYIAVSQTPTGDIVYKKGDLMGDGYRIQEIGKGIITLVKNGNIYYYNVTPATTNTKQETYYNTPTIKLPKQITRNNDTYSNNTYTGVQTTIESYKPKSITSDNSTSDKMNSLYNALK